MQRSSHRSRDSAASSDFASADCTLSPYAVAAFAIAASSSLRGAPIIARSIRSRLCVPSSAQWHVVAADVGHQESTSIDSRYSP